MSTKLLAVGTIILMNVVSMPLAYAGISEPETPPPTTVPTAEPTVPNPPVIDQTLQSISPDDIAKAAANESQAKTEIPAELSQASQPVYPQR